MTFQEFKSNAPVWEHFLKCKVNKTALCKTCNVIVTIKGGCTSVLQKHLKIKH